MIWSLQQQAEVFDAMEEENEYLDAEEEAACSREHAEGRARGVMAMMTGKIVTEKGEEDCKWSGSLFVWALLHNSQGFRSDMAPFPSRPAVAPQFTRISARRGAFLQN